MQYSMYLMRRQASLDGCCVMVHCLISWFIAGGLPCDWGDDSVKEVLAPYGPLRSFNLVMDKSTGGAVLYCHYTMYYIYIVTILYSHSVVVTNPGMALKAAAAVQRQ